MKKFEAPPNTAERPEKKSKGSKEQDQNNDRILEERWEKLFEKKGFKPLSAEAKEETRTRKILSYIDPRDGFGALRDHLSPFGPEERVWDAIESFSKQSDDPHDLRILAGLSLNYVSQEGAALSVYFKAIDNADEDFPFQLSVMNEVAEKNVADVLFEHHTIERFKEVIREYLKQHPTDGEVQEALGVLIERWVKATNPKPGTMRWLEENVEEMLSAYTVARENIELPLEAVARGKRPKPSDEVHDQVSRLDDRLKTAAMLRDEVMKYKDDPYNFVEYEHAAEEDMKAASEYQKRHPGTNYISSQYFGGALEYFKEARAKVKQLIDQGVNLKSRMKKLDDKIARIKS